MHERMGYYIADTIIGRVGNAYAMALAGSNVDVVNSGADAADNAQLRQRRDDSLGHRCVLNENAGAACSSVDQIVFGLALRRPELDPCRCEQRMLQLDVGIVPVGIQRFGHVAELVPLATRCSIRSEAPSLTAAHAPDKWFIDTAVVPVQVALHCPAIIVALPQSPR